jgi:hypothetical protein
MAAMMMLRCPFGMSSKQRLYQLSYPSNDEGLSEHSRDNSPTSFELKSGEYASIRMNLLIEYSTPPIKTPVNP